MQILRYALWRAIARIECFYLVQRKECARLYTSKAYTKGTLDLIPHVTLSNIQVVKKDELKEAETNTRLIITNNQVKDMHGFVWGALAISKPSLSRSLFGNKDASSSSPHEDASKEVHSPPLCLISSLITRVQRLTMALPTWSMM